jgi:hypothetical protein
LAAEFTPAWYCFLVCIWQRLGHFRGPQITQITQIKEQTWGGAGFCGITLYHWKSGMMPFFGLQITPITQILKSNSYRCRLIFWTVTDASHFLSPTEIAFQFTASQHK